MEDLKVNPYEWLQEERELVAKLLAPTGVITDYIVNPAEAFQKLGTTHYATSRRLLALVIEDPLSQAFGVKGLRHIGDMTVDKRRRQGSYSQTDRTYEFRLAHVSRVQTWRKDLTDLCEQLPQYVKRTSLFEHESSRTRKAISNMFGVTYIGQKYYRPEEAALFMLALAEWQPTHSLVDGEALADARHVAKKHCLEMLDEIEHAAACEATNEMWRSFDESVRNREEVQHAG